MPNRIEKYQQLISAKIEGRSYGDYPPELYEPISYIMALGGKRLRPLLVMMAYSLFEDDAENIADQALAVELFHNFTLMHDDIMDKAPLRRGKSAVHHVWDEPTAILSGDVMLVRAYDLLLESPSEKLKQVLRRFNECAAEVCEGQQLDMLFEDRKNVAEEEYIEMIRRKTAALLGFSLELGAILGGADEKDCQLLREFGTLAGIGFQLKDDLLDVYADSSKFGKQVGGDIIANKKTFLLIKSLEIAPPAQKKRLNSWLVKSEFKEQEKVEAVRKIYDELGIEKLTRNRIQEFFDEALHKLWKVDAPMPRKASLKKFAEKLIERDM